MRHTVIEDDRADLDIEMIEGFPTLHLNMKAKWSPSLCKIFMAHMYQVRKELGALGAPHVYAISHYGDKKLQKFHSLMGFEPFATLDDPDTGAKVMAVMRQENIGVENGSD